MGPWWTVVIGIVVGVIILICTVHFFDAHHPKISCIFIVLFIGAIICFLCVGLAWTSIGLLNSFFPYCIIALIFQGPKKRKKEEIPKPKAEVKSFAVHVIGVTFDDDTDRHYYIGDNDTYDINDTVIVPTDGSEEKIGTVVFKKIYYSEKDLPCRMNELKTVIAKVEYSVDVTDSISGDD